MTYGWAILIIALALGVLYSLGILNPKNFLPRAPPGSCFVFRPNGPGTTDYVSLQGTCGYLPMYVASFNGINGYIQISDSSSLDPQNQITLLAWFEPLTNNYSISFNLINKDWNGEYALIYGWDRIYFRIWATNGSNYRYDLGYHGWIPFKWNVVAISLSTISGKVILFRNGVLWNSTIPTGITFKSESSAISIGNSPQPIFIANLQIYKLL